MPLKHRDNAHIPESGGVTFVLSAPSGDDVACFVTGAALDAAARECGINSRDPSEMFLALRSAVEHCASDKYDLAPEPHRLVRVERADLLRPEEELVED